MCLLNYLPEQTVLIELHSIMVSGEWVISKPLAC